MTPRERTAFNAGIQTAIDFARIAAITIEARPDHEQIRSRAAVAALKGLADALKIEVADPGERSPVLKALDVIREHDGLSGEITCPVCAGRLRWARAASNGHIHGACETTGCLQWMQ